MPVLLFLSMLLLAATVMPLYAQEGIDAKKARAVAVADEIISMRSKLATAFIKPDTEITAETFNNVCGAVGKRVKEIMATEGFKIRHATLKNRNPMNAAKPDEISDLEMFATQKNLWDKWDTVEIEKKKYPRYQRAIFVEEACLACHGPRDKRPAFIVEKYPDDKAYDYNVGDLRGIISVIVPE